MLTPSTARSNFVNLFVPNSYKTPQTPSPMKSSKNIKRSSIRNMEETMHSKQASVGSMIPPVGLTIITHPADHLFEMYLDGKITAKTLVGLELKSGSIQNDKHIDGEYQLRVKEKEERLKVFNQNKITNVVDQIIRNSSPMKSQQSPKTMLYISDMRDELLNPERVQSPTRAATDRSGRLANLKIKIHQFHELSVAHKDSLIMRQQKKINIDMDMLKLPVKSKRHSMQKSASQCEIMLIIQNRKIKEQMFLKRCERMQGEKLSKEEEDLIMKSNKSEKDLWELTKRFSRKKWFFEMLFKKDDHRSAMSLLNTQQDTNELPWFNKLRDIIESKIKNRKNAIVRDPLLGQLENNINSVQNIMHQRVGEGDLLQSNPKKYFQHETPISYKLRQIQVVQDKPQIQTSNVKSIIEEAASCKIVITHQLNNAVETFMSQRRSSEILKQQKQQLNLKRQFKSHNRQHTTVVSNDDIKLFRYLNDNHKTELMEPGNLLESVYGFNFETGLSEDQTTFQNKKNSTNTRRPNKKVVASYRIIKRNDPTRLNNSLSGSNVSYASQNESCPSTTEVQLNNLYRETHLLQKLVKREYLRKHPSDDASKVQKRVRNIIKIGNIQSKIINVVNNKLDKKATNEF